MITDFKEQRGTDSFNSYLSKFKEQVSQEESSNFYHVDVVAEAYTQGFFDGEKSGKKEFVENLLKRTTERFTQKSTQVYILTNVAVNHFKKNGYPVNAFYLNIVHNNPKALISVDSDSLLNDEFVEMAYSKIFELKKIFFNLFESTFDIGLVASEGLDLSIIKDEGFDYSETIATIDE